MAERDFAREDIDEREHDLHLPGDQRRDRGDRRRARGRPRQPLRRPRTTATGAPDVPKADLDGRRGGRSRGRRSWPSRPTTRPTSWSSSLLNLLLQPSAIPLTISEEVASPLKVVERDHGRGARPGPDLAPAPRRPDRRPLPRPPPPGPPPQAPDHRRPLGRGQRGHPGSTDRLTAAGAQLRRLPHPGRRPRPYRSGLARPDPRPPRSRRPDRPGSPRTGPGGGVSEWSVVSGQWSVISGQSSAILAVRENSVIGRPARRDFLNILLTADSLLAGHRPLDRLTEAPG